MKKIYFILLALLITPGVVFGQASTLNRLDQWVSTTSPTAITQRVINIPIKISGLTPLLPLCLDSNNLITNTGCTGGAGGGGGAGTFSTTTSSVSGQLINYSNNTTDIVTVGSNSTTTAEFYFDPNTNRFIVNSGSVGIGTAVPSDTLHIVGGDIRIAKSNSVANTITNNINFVNTNVTLSPIAAISVRTGATTANSNLVFQTANSGTMAEVVRFTGAGNVGIGTTSPQTQLEISGTSGATQTEALRLTSLSNSSDAGRYISYYGNNGQGIEQSRLTFARPGASATGYIGFSTYNTSTLNEKMRLDYQGLRIGSTYTAGTTFAPANGLVVEGNVGIGTTTPYAPLSVVGQIVGSYFTGTSTTATSTFANGINLTGGCLAVNGTCFAGGGGSSANPTITTTLPFTNCEAQTDSYDFAPGGAYIQPIYGATFTNGTSSAIACDLTIPDNVSATPNGVIMPYLTATTTGNSVFEVNATTTSIGQNWIPTSYTNLLASTSAASRIAVTGGANYPLTSTTTISTNALNIVAGSILKVRFVNYHADANDTVENDLFMPKAVYKFDIKVN